MVGWPPSFRYHVSISCIVPLRMLKAAHRCVSRCMSQGLFWGRRPCSARGTRAIKNETLTRCRHRPMRPENPIRSADAEKKDGSKRIRTQVPRTMYSTSHTATPQVLTYLTKQAQYHTVFCAARNTTWVHFLIHSRHQQGLKNLQVMYAQSEEEIDTV